MEILKRPLVRFLGAAASPPKAPVAGNTSILSALTVSTFLLTSCGPINTVTETVPLDTDTYISSTDSGNHSEFTYLDLSKSTSLEERIIVKLPTTNDDASGVVSQTLEDLLVTLFFFPLTIISDLLSCEQQIVQPQNLTSAELVFDIGTNPQGPLDGKVSLLSLTKPWYQSVNWNVAHPFSGRGRWSNPGGDTDPNFTPITAVSTGTNSIEFDITAYFKSLIIANGQAVHYGFLLESTAGALLSPVTLNSTQLTDSSARPRLVSVYVGPTCDPSGSGSSFEAGNRTRRRTTILGRKPIVIDEVL